MKSLLAKLDVEGFLFDIDGGLRRWLPAIEGATLLATDDHTLTSTCRARMDLNRCSPRSTPPASACARCAPRPTASRNCSCA